MAGPHLWSKGEFRPAIRGAWVAIVSWPLTILVPSNSPVAGQDILPNWQGFRVWTEQGMGCV